MFYEACLSDEANPEGLGERVARRERCNKRHTEQRDVRSMQMRRQVGKQISNWDACTHTKRKWTDGRING